MYRIIFNPRTAQWEIHLQHLVIFWRRVVGETFDNFEAAQKRCFELGLDQVYKCWNNRPSLFHIPEAQHRVVLPEAYYNPAVLRTRQVIGEDRGHGHNL